MWPQSILWWMMTNSWYNEQSQKWTTWLAFLNNFSKSKTAQLYIFRCCTHFLELGRLFQSHWPTVNETKIFYVSTYKTYNKHDDKQKQFKNLANNYGTIPDVWEPRYRAQVVWSSFVASGGQAFPHMAAGVDSAPCDSDRQYFLN